MYSEFSQFETFVRLSSRHGIFIVDNYDRIIYEIQTSYDVFDDAGRMDQSPPAGHAEILKAENKILREKLGKKRLLLNDDQRRRLAVLGKKLSRKALAEICEVFFPDTLLRWHRMLVARKYEMLSKRLYKPYGFFYSRKFNH